MNEANLIIKEMLLRHNDKAWNECLHYKATRDEIIKFMGTLFMAALFSSGILVYKTLNLPEKDTSLNVFRNIYFAQYFLVHLLYVILYFYYKYNGIKEKIFLLQAQCSQKKINEIDYESICVDKEEIKKVIPVDFYLLKKIYIENPVDELPKPESYKTIANYFLFACYFSFALIPLTNFLPNSVLPTKLEIFKDGGVYVGYNAIFVIIGVSSLMYYINLRNTKMITGIKKEILRNWGFQKPDQDPLDLG